MNRIKQLVFKSSVITILLSTWSMPAQTQEISKLRPLATKQEAKALFRWAMVYLNTNGREAAFQAFNQRNSIFKDRDLYVFCLNNKKVWLAMGAKPSLVGESAEGLRDANGKDFVKEFIVIAKKTDFGISTYLYKNPVTGEEQPKVSFIQKISETEFCGMGYYINPITAQDGE